MASKDVKERIRKAAAELFMEKGYGGTSVRELGDRAGVSQSSLYHHAGSKADILFDLHKTFIDDLIVKFEAAVVEPIPAREQLLRIFQVELEVVAMHKAEVTVFLREQHALQGEHAVRLVERREQADRLVDQVIRRGVLAGEFRDVDVRLLRFALFGMCNWSYQWFSPAGQYTHEQVAEIFYNLLTEGILRHDVEPAVARAEAVLAEG
ncbi:TetR/AcrR family transcriptional regulator [Pseudonocardia sp. RS010]|uniref:TetR/AcrR family transcriptional regulator n=1 Tax=Pseudonocardia sp. RS010 TaxID=3385979 RepID=UPI0039A3E109